MELLEMMKNRRSVRTYTGEPVPKEKLEKILQAGLLSASGRAIRPWEFIVVQKKETLKRMAGSRAAGAKMLEEADCAIVVLGDEEKSDVWTEDCSIVMANMHLMADSLSVGSCWIQGRLREASDGRTTEEYVRALLGYPAHMRLEAILSLGIPKDHPEPHTTEELLTEKIHWECYAGQKEEQIAVCLPIIIKRIGEFWRELELMSEDSSAVSVDRQKFTLLLSGVSTCRKIPGIQEHMGYDELYHCDSEDDRKQAGTFLENMYKIHDRESLQTALLREFSDCEQYEQFRTFWVGAPMFELEELLPENRAWFEFSRDVAEQFYSIVKEKGFYAWDISEKIGICRKAAACGIISDEEFWQITDPYVRMAQAFYHSWKEYALSCLCGSVYFMRSQGSQLREFADLNIKLIRQLFAEGMAWRKHAWYTPKTREWAELFDLSQKCLITKKALENGQIGYMYKQEPEPEFADCGWRFLTGDETEAYVNEPGNIIMCRYSDVCNLDPSVRAYFYAACGMQYERVADGWAEIQ